MQNAAQAGGTDALHGIYAEKPNDHGQAQGENTDQERIQCPLGAHHHYKAGGSDAEFSAGAVGEDDSAPQDGHHGSVLLGCHSPYRVLGSVAVEVRVFPFLACVEAWLMGPLVI